MASTYTDRTERSGLRPETTGSLAEIAGGIAVIVLSIIGLARVGNLGGNLAGNVGNAVGNVAGNAVGNAAGNAAGAVGSTINGLAHTMGSLPAISTIILGAAIIAEGGTIASGFSRLANENAGATGAAQVGGGMTTEIVIGAVVLILGVLALLGVSPVTLVPSAIILAGSLLLIGAANVQRMNSAKISLLNSNGSTQALQQPGISAAAGFQVLGVAAVVLGILALASTIHIAAFMLVGLLVLGAAFTMSGGSLTGSLTRPAVRRDADVRVRGTY